jgi:AraC-like DNA-binding protein
VDQKRNMADLPYVWRERAMDLAPYAPAAATAFEAAARELTEAIDAHENEPLTLDEAAEWSGYSSSQIRRLFPGQQTVPRGWLPKKPRKVARSNETQVSSRSQAVRDLLRSIS